MKALKIFEDKISTVFKIITAVILFVQMVIVFVGVIAHYVFNSPQPWIDEITTYLLVDITYLGGFVALRSGAMASITFIRDALHGGLKKVLCVLSDACMMILMLAIAVYGYKLCCMPTVLNQKTPSLQLPIIIFYAVIPISGVLMELSMIRRLVGDIRGEDTETHEEGAFVD